MCSETRFACFSRQGMPCLYGVVVFAGIRRIIISFAPMNQLLFKILSIISLALSIFIVLILMIIPAFLFQGHEGASYGTQIFFWLLYYSIFLIPSVFTFLTFRKKQVWIILLLLFVANIGILFWKVIPMAKMFIEAWF